MLRQFNLMLHGKWCVFTLMPCLKVKICQLPITWPRSRKCAQSSSNQMYRFAFNALATGSFGKRSERHGLYGARPSCGHVRLARFHIGHILLLRGPYICSLCPRLCAGAKSIVPGAGSPSPGRARGLLATLVVRICPMSKSVMLST